MSTRIVARRVRHRRPGHRWAVYLHPSDPDPDPDAAAGDLRLGGDAAATAGMRSSRQQLEETEPVFLVVNAGDGSLLRLMALLRAALAWFRTERLRY